MDNSAITAVKPKVRRPGSGRTKGAFSFLLLWVADIKTKLADENTKFPVSRKWAEQLGFVGVEAKPAGKTMDKIEGTLETTAVQAKVRDLDQED